MPETSRTGSCSHTRLQKRNKKRVCSAQTRSDEVLRPVPAFANSKDTQRRQTRRECLHELRAAYSRSGTAAVSERCPHPARDAPPILYVWYERARVVDSRHWHTQ